MTLVYFTEAEEQIAAALPQHWHAKDVPGSESQLAIAALAELADELAAETEGIFNDMRLSTARVDALREEWALLYDADDEQLPPTVDTLRAYLQARAAEDGTRGSLERVLVAMVDTAANRAKPGVPAAIVAHLTFPVDGTGLQFPADGTGIQFPASGWLEVIDHPATFYLEIRVLDYLDFDRNAFERAVLRHNPGHYAPPTITETDPV